MVDEYQDRSKTKEKKIQLRFINSFRFMASGLDSLTSNLVKGGQKLTGFKDYSDDQYALLVRKGVYSYEYVTSWDKFTETQLPPKEAFHSISENDYEHAQKVWRAFNLMDLGEYHDLYLKTDVLLLANVFEAFRGTCLEYYKLDPAHFYTSPGLAWQACLEKTGVKLELLTDHDMLLMFECGNRGGITQAVHRYVKAKNKYMGKQHNPEEESSFLQYLDVNNLYGWAMSQPLPTGGFKWVMPDGITEHSDKGYLLEVDVKYPKEVHDLHNDLPFMCEKMEINKVEKLVPNLYDKKNYVIHIQVLNQALKHGLILERVHRMIEFDQSAWLKPYIDFNTQLRTQAKNDFEKDFFKLMNNSVFGKMMENIRKHKDIKLVTNTKDYLKNVMKPNFKSGMLFGENLMRCEMGKTKVVMNKPVYLSKAFYEDIAKDVQTKFYASGCCKDRPLPMGLNKMVIGLMKDELGGAIMTEYVALRPKLYSYRKLDGAEDKKCRGIKKCMVKKTLACDDYKECLLNPTNGSTFRWQLMFRSKKHEVHTVEINKVALNRDDKKQIAKKDIVSTLVCGHKSLCWNPLLREIVL